jgi:hypothetical protein
VDKNLSDDALEILRDTIVMDNLIEISIKNQLYKLGIDAHVKYVRGGKQVDPIYVIEFNTQEDLNLYKMMLGSVSVIGWCKLVVGEK